jgi:hypothetical protein
MDVIDRTAVDPSPFRTLDRALILAAIDRSAAEHDGLVHAAWVRPLLPRYVDSHSVGAVICALVRQRVLVGTGDYLPNGNHRTRNRTKPSEVRRLTRPISQEAA